MELFQSATEYTVRGACSSCLSCSRSSGSMEIKAASDVDLSKAVCLGLVEGVVGKFQFHPDLECFLVLIQRKGFVGTVPGQHEMYKIAKVAVIPLTNAEPQDLKLEFCKVHMKAADECTLTVNSKKQLGDPGAKRQSSGEEKLERRLLEEVVKMFTDSDSFFFSPTYDITNSAQRQWHHLNDRHGLLAKVDDRFFWNKYMVRDLLEKKVGLAFSWIIPIIQGFVQVKEVHISYSKHLVGEAAQPGCVVGEDTPQVPGAKFLFVLISRRSRYRGGMRYKRRGIDSNGNVANYVETEQLIYSGDNVLSFVQIRGSIPVFWSQEGYRYKPRPKLHKSEEENTEAFQIHFMEQFKIYNKGVIINLVKQKGPEKVISDAYRRQVELFNDPRLIYVSFDFHQQCQGRRFENVELLTEGIRNIISDQQWFSLNSGVVVTEQEGVLRTNCMDCLDRTNVVQTAISRHILEQQLKVLKLLPPQCRLSHKSLRTFQIMWANNGDAISRQYAGTAAMKSDFTRTGESNFSGAMKDGYRSANRYYLHHFRHAYRQTVIDLMHGAQMTINLHALIGKQKPARVLLVKEQRRRQKQEIEALITTFSALLIPVTEKLLGGWLFVNCNPRVKGLPKQDLDVLLLLSDEACYFAHINTRCKVSQSKRIVLSDLERIEMSHHHRTRENAHKICMKVYYNCSGKGTSQYVLRPALLPQQGGNQAVVIRRAKQAITGVEMPIIAERIRSKYFMESVWTMLVSFIHFIVAGVKSIFKPCQRRKHSKVSTSHSRLVESRNKERVETSPLIVAPCGPTERREIRDRILSIYLPSGGRAKLQASHYRLVPVVPEGADSLRVLDRDWGLVSIKSSSSTSASLSPSASPDGRDEDDPARCPGGEVPRSPQRRPKKPRRQWQEDSLDSSGSSTPSLPGTVYTQSDK
ncbi:phosphatidylinositide phosphatase SAC2-like [Rhinoraja longicauda]